MIILEIPKQTLEHELEILDGLGQVPHFQDYIAGAKDVLQWLLTHGVAPSEGLVIRLNGGDNGC